MANLKKSLENINVKIDGKKPEVQAAHNYKEIIKAAKKQISGLDDGMKQLSQVSETNDFLQSSSKSMLQLNAELMV